MNYPAAELRSIKMNFYLINPDAEHRGILLIKPSMISKKVQNTCHVFSRRKSRGVSDPVLERACGNSSQLHPLRLGSETSRLLKQKGLESRL